MRAFAAVFKDSAAARMMDVLFERWNSEISKSDLARAAGISRDSIYRILPDWERLGIVKKTRQDGVTKLYALNKENEAVIALKNFESLISGKNFLRPESEERPAEKIFSVETAPDRLKMIKMKTDSMLSAVSGEKPEDENAAQIRALFEKGAISRRTYEELLKNLKK